MGVLLQGERTQGGSGKELAGLLVFGNAEVGDGESGEGLLVAGGDDDVDGGDAVSHQGLPREALRC